ncbi:MAG: PAS domain S-box protein, partial [Parafilimonas sp.]
MPTENRQDELILINKKLGFQNKERQKRANELIIANKELVFQNKEKETRAAELVVANKELVFQNKEKEKRAAELVVANKELAFQHKEKGRRADELIIANKELAFQNKEKEKRADELVIANKELLFQNEEKEKRADELAKERQNFYDNIINKEKRFRALIENGADAVLILTAEGRPTYVSRSLSRILGYTEEEAKNLVLGENIHPDDQAHVAQKMEECLAKPGIAIRGGTARVKHKNGTWVSMDATLTNMLHDPNINGIINNTWDVTESKLAEQKILHANRLYAFLSQINQAIVHIKDEQTLFNKACTIAVEQGKFSMALIGIADSEIRKIKLAASYGVPEKDLQMLSEYYYENDGPIDKIMNGFDYVIVNDIKKTSKIKLKKYAEERGMNSCIFLALKREGKTIGVFNIYSSETDFFTSEEIKLLTQATVDISFALDVFEKDKQKQEANERYRHSQRHLNRAQAVANIGSWEVDSSTDLSTWSDELLRIYGLPEEDCIQTYQSWISFIHPEDVKDVIQITNEAKSALSGCEYFYRIIRKDGTIRHLYSQTRMEFNSLEKSIGLYGVTHDITETKEAEVALRESESNMHAIFDHTSDGFILADNKGIIKSFNNKSRDRIWLNTEQEIHKGDSIFTFIHESRKDLYKDSISKVLAGEVLHYDYPYTRKNGVTKWFSFTVNPVYNGNDITGLSITSSDITERKQTEQQLSESELFNKGILASLHSHIAVINDSGTIIAINQAWDDFAKENGVTSLERVSTGSNYFGVCKKAFASGEAFAGLALDGIQSVFKKERQSFELEYPCHSPSEKRWFTMHVSNFGDDESKVVISHLNITERKISEQKLIQSEKRSRDLFERSIIGLALARMDGTLVDVNEAYAKIIGRTIEETKKLTYWEITPEKYIEQENEILKELSNTGKFINYEKEYIHKEGYLVPVRLSGNIIEQEGEKFIWSSIEDITETKRLEKAVENERDQFFDMFLKAPSAIGMLKGPDHVFEMVNPLYLQLIGKKDVIGKTVAEVLPEVIEQGFIDLLDIVYKSGKSYTGTEVLIKLDKEGNGEFTDAYLNFVYQAYKNNEGNIAGVFF